MLQRIILIIGIITIMNPLFAQNTTEEEKEKKCNVSHELSIGALEMFNKSQTVQYYYPFWNSYYIEPPYYSNVGPQLPKIGLSYKIHFDKWTLRIRDDFIGYTQQYWAGDNYQKLSGLENKINIGVQKEKRFKRVVFFYGIDAFHEKEYSKSIYEYDASPSSESVSNKRAYGLSPFIGGYYYLTKKLSLSFETNFEVQYFELDDIYTYDQTENKTKYNGIVGQFGPLGLVSINFHLGE